MKKHLNTMFVTTQGTYLHKEGETVQIKVENETKGYIPVHTIGGIVCFGRVSISPPLMGFCAENDVAVSFLSEHGRFLASVRGPVSGNVLLRRTQYRMADNRNDSANLARFFLMGKISNCRRVIDRTLRDHGEKIASDDLSEASARLKSSLDALRQASDLDSLRGIEGESAKNYFSVFDHLILSKKDEFRFNGRSRRPPLDKVNCLISFIYTLLMHDVRSALESVGLDPAVGFLHRDRPGRPGFALDMMEEFRPYFADRLALSLINLSQVKPSGFRSTESGAVLMDDETRKNLLVAYQKRKQEEIYHPFIDEKITLGLVFHIQAMLLARFMRGDIDAYPPFIWK